MPYDRLKSLHALSLENERTLADMIIVYKCLRHKLNCPAADLGLVFNVNTVTRRNNIRLEQFITQRSYEQYFCFRVPALWNKISVNTINCLSAKTFKKHLSSSLFLSQWLFCSLVTVYLCRPKFHSCFYAHVCVLLLLFVTGALTSDKRTWSMPISPYENKRSFIYF